MDLYQRPNSSLRGRFVGKANFIRSHRGGAVGFKVTRWTSGRGHRLTIPNSARTMPLERRLHRCVPDGVELPRGLGPAGNGTAVLPTWARWSDDVEVDGQNRQRRGPRSRGARVCVRGRQGQTQLH